MTGDFHSGDRGQVWDLWDKTDLTEWNGLTWGTWENGGEDWLMWHISNNPECLGKESWENSELSILPIQVFQIWQGNTFQNWMLKRIVPKGEMKMPKFSVQYCQACPWQYGGKKLLGQQQATLLRCKMESVFVPLWNGGLGGSNHTLINFQAFWSPSFLTLKRQFYMEVFHFHLEEENTSFWYSHPED